MEVVRRTITALFLVAVAIVSGCTNPSTNLHIVGEASNDLVKVLEANNIEFERYDDLWQAINDASENTGVMVLADHYPNVRTYMDAEMFVAAEAKNLRVYIEFPALIPDIEIAEGDYFKEQANVADVSLRYQKTGGNQYISTGHYGAVIERVVVNSDAFEGLPKMTILELKDCYYVPVDIAEAHLVLSQVEGYNTAVFGITEKSSPLLFEHPNHNILVGTTKLSQFVSGRYAPNDSWAHVIGMIVKWTSGDDEMQQLTWTPTVSPMYLQGESVPANGEAVALQRGIAYYDKSNLYLHPGWPLLSPSDSLDGSWPKGDGSYGIGECYISKRIFHTGAQPVSLNARADCNFESAMGLACGTKVLENPDYYAKKAGLLNDFILNSSAFHGSIADSATGSFGLLEWYVSPEPGKGLYWGDDNARALLALITTAGLLNESRWDDAIIMATLGNFRTTGVNGYRPRNINEQQLQENGWQYYYNLDHIDYCPHMQSYLWAMYLWLYDKTKFTPLLEKAKKGIKMMMEAYPNWTLEANREEQERCRMLLPLAWLVRVDDTPEHRLWLDQMAQYVIALQDDSGAIPQIPGKVLDSNKQYGAGEGAMAHQAGDPVTDALYSINFAFLGLHEAASVTGDSAYTEAADRLADFFVRTQTKSQCRPELDGTWYRGFDFEKWDYWGSDGDAGWGVWTNEIGWTHSWITATLAVRALNTTFWDITSGSKVASKFDHYRKVMLPTIED